MKMKRILSTALTVIMLFSAIAAVLPVYSGAAHSPSAVVSESTLSLEEITKYVNDKYLKYNFNTAEEMLEAELSAGYLDYVTTANGLYTMYVNNSVFFVTATKRMVVAKRLTCRILCGIIDMIIPSLVSVMRPRIRSYPFKNNKLVFPHKRGRFYVMGL